MTSQNTALTQRQTPGLDQPQESEVLTATPPVDIYENQEEILVVADFPGVPKESLSVQLDRAELLIEGTQTTSEGREQVRFSRAFRVPNTVDPNGVTAELSRGVLRVHLAKSEAAKPKRVEVRGS